MTASTWMMAIVDAIAIAMLGAVLWRLRRDPEAGWDAREHRLGEIFDRIRVLIAQSEGIARDLDASLAAHATRLRALLDEARRATDDAPAAGGDDVVARVRRLAAAAVPIDEIARRVDMPAAEVRVLVALHGARNAATKSAQARATTVRQ